MASLGRYKDKERVAAQKVSHFFKMIFSGIGNAVVKFFKTGAKKITIMLVPHSEKRILNIQISLFGLAFFGLLSIGLIGGLVYSVTNYSDLALRLSGKTEVLKTTQADLDAIRDSTARLVKAAKSFQVALDSTLVNIGSNTKANNSNSGKGDLAAFFTDSEIGSGRLKEASEIERVSQYLEHSIEPLNEISESIITQGGVLSEIPNIWPIKGGIGHISMYYGQNENPIYGSWYLHRGIDLSTFRAGDPILAAADGKVITVAFEVSLGNYIVIEHKHGFITRYAHMSAFKVKKGDTVKQGQTIGYIGNTGLSTGPHLHYEVHLGTETIDPLRFLNIKNNNTALTQ